jgi:glyoxylase-like metal-dependent hydrolase (beta-lactamase superfamily II)
MQQAPGFYRRAIGDSVVTAFSDGYFDLPSDVFSGLSAQDCAQLLKNSHRPSPPRIQVNAFLVERAGKRTLIDTGCGSLLGPTVNKLRENLAAANVDLNSISTILCTHIHPDHTNGLVDEGGNATFVNAEVCVNRTEAAFWINDSNAAKAAPEIKIQFEWARRAFAPYQARTRTFDEGPVVAGIDAIPLRGHTPGHCGFVVHSGSEALLIWGDTVHSIGIQTTRPDVSFAYDVDQQAARETRLHLFDRVVADRLLITGMHLEFPGFGYLTNDAGNYRYQPMPWSPTMTP